MNLAANTLAYCDTATGEATQKDSILLIPDFTDEWIQQFYPLSFFKASILVIFIYLKMYFLSLNSCCKFGAFHDKKLPNLPKLLSLNLTASDLNLKIAECGFGLQSYLSCVAPPRKFKPMEGIFKGIFATKHWCHDTQHNNIQHYDTQHNDAHQNDSTITTP